MYDKVSCPIRDKVEISKHYSGRYGAPGQGREKRDKPTPEEMAKQNHWRRCRDLRRLIELNFSPGDWHVTLTCEKEKRPTREEAPKVIRKFLAKLKRNYKKQGWELKYVVTCEVGKRGAVHWHMVVNNMANGITDAAKLINGNWERGRTYFSILESSGEYGKLAEYMVKEAAYKIDKGETQEKMSYSHSRNLKKPVEHREKVRAAGWRKDPAIPKGWELVPGSLVNETNKFTGLPYQHYVIRRKEEDGGGSKTVHKDKPERTKAAAGSKHIPHGDERKWPDGNGGRDSNPGGDDGGKGDTEGT